MNSQSKRVALRKQNGGDILNKSFGFSGLAYNQVVVFQSEEMLRTVLEANPHMEPIIGTGQGMEADFPGVYIAGIRANLPMDSKADGYRAIQK